MRLVTSVATICLLPLIALEDIVEKGEIIIKQQLSIFLILPGKSCQSGYPYHQWWGNHCNCGVEEKIVFLFFILHHECLFALPCVEEEHCGFRVRDFVKSTSLNSNFFCYGLRAGMD